MPLCGGKKAFFPGKKVAYASLAFYHNRGFNRRIGEKGLLLMIAVLLGHGLSAFICGILLSRIRLSRSAAVTKTVTINSLNRKTKFTWFIGALFYLSAQREQYRRLEILFPETSLIAGVMKDLIQALTLIRLRIFHPLLAIILFILFNIYSN